jgi:hypothetical protein
MAPADVRHGSLASLAMRLVLHDGSRAPLHETRGLVRPFAEYLPRTGAPEPVTLAGKEKIMRRTVALSLTLVLLMLAFGPISLPAQVSNAQLVGEWVGNWKVEHGAGPKPTPPRGEQSTGEYRLTIIKVEDGKVHGRVQQPGLAA